MAPLLDRTLSIIEINQTTVKRLTLSFLSLLIAPGERQVRLTRADQHVKFSADRHGSDILVEDGPLVGKTVPHAQVIIVIFPAYAARKVIIRKGSRGPRGPRGPGDPIRCFGETIIGYLEWRIGRCIGTYRMGWA